MYVVATMVFAAGQSDGHVLFAVYGEPGGKQDDEVDKAQQREGYEYLPQSEWMVEWRFAVRVSALLSGIFTPGAQKWSWIGRGRVGIPLELCLVGIG